MTDKHNVAMALNALVELNVASIQPEEHNLKGEAKEKRLVECCNIIRATMLEMDGDSK